MPEAFDRCQKAGGRIRTVSGPNKKLGLSKDEYVHVCFSKGDMHRGYVKTKSTEKALKAGK